MIRYDYGKAMKFSQASAKDIKIKPQPLVLKSIIKHLSRTFFFRTDHITSPHLTNLPSSAFTGVAMFLCSSSLPLPLELGTAKRLLFLGIGEMVFFRVLLGH